jgi:hypothetical protein
VEVREVPGIESQVEGAPRYGGVPGHFGALPAIAGREDGDRRAAPHDADIVHLVVGCPVKAVAKAGVHGRKFHISLAVVYIHLDLFRCSRRSLLVISQPLPVPVGPVHILLR